MRHQPLFFSYHVEQVAEVDLVPRTVRRHELVLPRQRAPDVEDVEVAGVRRKVNVGLLEDGVRVGDWVLIHVGFALSKVDEAEARATLRLLQEMGDAYEQELEDLKASAI